jgi:hypothetical protein
MRGLNTTLFAVGVVAAGLLGTAEAARNGEMALQPALLTWSEGLPGPELQLVSGRHSGHGGHRHHLDRRSFRHDSRHFHHFDHRRHGFHRHDHFVHERPWLHHGALGVSFCIRSSGVLFCFNDSVRPHHY